MDVYLAGESSRDASGGVGEGFESRGGEGGENLGALVNPVATLRGEDALAGERLERVVQGGFHRLRAEGGVREGRAADVREGTVADDGAERAVGSRTVGGSFGEGRHPS